MFPLRTMPSLKSSKSTSTNVTASKIKNKILNSSSFFKVSLKTNNKALAVALEVQKERSRQLEMEIVYYQKQVEALCFELATKKYKQRRLLLILDTLRSNTLQQLDEVDDLFSDSDKHEDNKIVSGDINKENHVMGSLTDLVPPQREIPRNVLCPLQNVTADLPEKDICAFQNRPRESTDVFNDNMHAEKRRSTQTGTSRPSSSLRDEVERLSMMFSQPGFDMKSFPCLQNSHTPPAVRTCGTPRPFVSEDDPLPSSSVMETEPQHANKQEKSVLLNATMEMTLSNSSEIVVVETKAKRKGRSGKPKSRRIRNKPVPSAWRKIHK
ncbi:shugoshin 2-like [Cottoperca gobio]|uniref:Shugoshin 2-like n=1 Tax=Cottoperca gobio TaxID=56716 RepID=A0A6J2S1E8_COTGO|nr:shugoshin 2-like [Cottoperca gobio]